jgi:histidinol-phosphate aminotransferase
MANASEIDTTWLNANENPYVPAVEINPELYNRYPDFQPEPLLNAYAQYAEMNAEQVLVTRGADEGIELLIRTFCEPGESILICPPTYGMYQISAETCGAQVIKVPTLTDYQLDVDSIKVQLDKVKVTFICSPNNPTGQVISRRDLIDIIEAAKGKCLVVADEAYIEFCPDASVADLIDDYDNLVVLRTLSKAFGLAGLRCGFTLSNVNVINALKKVIAPYPVPAPVAQIAAQTLSAEGLTWMKSKVIEINKLKQQFIEQAKQWQWVDSVLPSDTNFVLLKLSSALLASDVIESFLAQRILLRDQSKQLNLTNTVRVTIGNADQMEQVIALFSQINQTTQAQ